MHGVEDSNADVYRRDVDGYVQTSLLEGFNSTIMSYGVANSGKTCTLFGQRPTENSDPSSYDSLGVVQLSILRLFEMIEHLRNEQPDRYFLVHGSVLLLAGNTIYDPLQVGPSYVLY